MLCYVDFWPEKMLVGEKVAYIFGLDIFLET